MFPISRGLSVIRLTGRLLAALAAVALLLGQHPAQVAAASPAALFFPGGCRQPDHGSVQSCIDTAVDGDRISIRTDRYADPIQISDKSVWLVAGAGYTPVFSDLVSIEATSGTRSDRVIGIKSKRGFTINLTGGQNHAVTLANDTIKSKDSVHGALRVFTTVSSRVTVRKSRIASPTAWAVFYTSQAFEGMTATFNLVGNRITGGYRTAAGVLISRSGRGALVANVYNNAISGIHCGANCGFDPLGGLVATSTNRGSMLVNIVGDTIDDVNPQPAVRITNTQSAGGQMTVNVYNSLITRTPMAVYIHSSSSSAASSMTFSAGSNDYHDVLHASHLESYSLGSDNRFVDPEYVDEYGGNLRLRPGSPVIDAGTVCSPGGVADPDADGNHRLAGKGIDLGAYETNAAPPTGTVKVGTDAADTLTGTSSADILCGMGGHDRLAGAGGGDYLDGGDGNDILIGSNGKDRLYGDAGDDTLCGHDGKRGNDLLDGGAGTDSYEADKGDTLIGVERKSSC
jgi:hypothetical protein